MSRKITINLYSPLHQETLAIQDLDWEKDTLDVVAFGLANTWNVENHYPTFWIGLKEFEDVKTKSLKDQGLKHGDWIGVGWAAIKRYDDIFTIEVQ
jgi:hypothetical protein